MQARRLRFPGEPRVFVLYRPRQYPLARALLGVHEPAELWYVRPDPAVFRTGAERSDSTTSLALAPSVCSSRLRTATRAPRTSRSGSADSSSG